MEPNMFLVDLRGFERIISSEQFPLQLNEEFHFEYSMLNDNNEISQWEQIPYRMNWNLVWWDISSMSRKQWCWWRINSLNRRWDRRNHRVIECFWIYWSLSMLNRTFDGFQFVVDHRLVHVDLWNESSNVRFHRSTKTTNQWEIFFSLSLRSTHQK